MRNFKTRKLNATSLRLQACAVQVLLSRGWRPTPYLIVPTGSSRSRWEVTTGEGFDDKGLLRAVSELAAISE